MAVDVSTHTVLVTGASSGIGRAFATALAGRGVDLVLVARRADRLEALAAELRAGTGVAVTVVPFDLSAPGVGPGLRDAVAARGAGVTAVINNAGFGTFGMFGGEDQDRLDREIAVDVAAPVAIARAFLPQVQAARGFLINVASMAAYNPTPRMAVYGAAKAFVLSFTESLWAELRGTGVTVFALSPGATATEFNDVVGTEDATSGARKRTAEDVVGTALRHLARRDPGPSVIDGRVNRLSSLAARFLPRRAMVSVVARITDPGRRGSAPQPVPAG